MQSKQILLPAPQRHEAFLRSAQFAPELARIPFKWRNRVITAALAKMAWSSWYKVYESVATSFVREFAEQYVPAGVDLSQSDADIVATAERAADGVTKMLWMAVSDTHALQIMEDECASYGIELPEFDALTDTIARLVDARWWRRQLRKRVKRTFEAGNIRLGYVKYSGEPYASNDAVLSRLAQNRRNAAALAATLVQNENGQQFSIAELAEKTTANKAIRRGELMLRINGFEQIARECGDQGIFITWTCPSRFHAMQHSGKPNDKFDGSTPREANAYLGKMTSLCRSALARRGIGLYGFRIAEPHHDGCPHWHLLLFVRPTAKYKTAHLRDVAGRAIRIMKRYAWRVDRGEPGAFARRRGEDIIDMSMGNPDGATPAHIVDKLIDTVKRPDTHGYSASKGIPRLRRAISHWYKKRYDVDIDPDSEAIVTIGSKEGLAHLMLATLDRGDTVLVIENCSRPDQRIVRLPLSALAHGLGDAHGPVLVMLGNVLVFRKPKPVALNAKLA